VPSEVTLGGELLGAAYTFIFVFFSLIFELNNPGAAYTRNNIVCSLWTSPHDFEEKCIKEKKRGKEKAW